MKTSSVTGKCLKYNVSILAFAESASSTVRVQS
jgi:hypothetical protein